jgi:hypothetical protein
MPPGWGKCTERLSADVPDVVYEAATRRRLQLDMSESQYVRFLVVRDAMGVEAVRRMHEEQLALLLGTGPEPAPASPQKVEGP